MPHCKVEVHTLSIDPAKIGSTYGCSRRPVSQAVSGPYLHPGSVSGSISFIGLTTGSNHAACDEIH